MQAQNRGFLMNLLHFSALGSQSAQRIKIEKKGSW
jgi:hypothetical protein